AARHRPVARVPVLSGSPDRARLSATSAKWRRLMTEVPQLAETEASALAVEAFFYGFPLVSDLSEVRRFDREGIGAVPATPYNEFGHANRLAGPQTKFVSVSNDTVYSLANVDVSAGPVRLEVPDTQGRYYVLQFVDAWTNNFAYVGHRSTGTKAGSFLL